MSLKYLTRSISPWVARFSLALAATFISLLVGEVVIRIFGRAPASKSIHLGTTNCIYRRSTNPILGFELKENYRHDQPDLIQNYERTNAHGQRDKERATEKPPGVRRILLLGDSVVEGYRLRHDETISHQLEELFQDENTEVLNFGVSAYCTRAEVELLEVKGLKFNPDVVVLVFVENDFDNFNREAFPLGGTMDRPALAQFLFANSHAFRLACFQWDLFHFGAESDPVQWNQQAIGNNNVPAGLKRFRELADLHGFRPVIAIWPRFLDEEIIDVHFMPQSTTELVVERLASTPAIPSFRLSEFFRQHQAESRASTNPRLRYSLGDELHPSAEGARIAATAIHRYLAEPRTESLAVDRQNRSAADAVAIKAAQDLGGAQPNYARVYNRLGTELYKAGKFDEAVEQFKKALHEDPQHAGAHNNLGLAWQQLGSDQAQTHFVRAVELQPDFAQAHFNLSRSLLRQGRPKAALLGLQRTIQIDPNHVGALNLLGLELGKLKQLDGARSYLERVFQIEPNNAEAHNNLGVVLAAQGKLRDAVTHFQAAVEGDPSHPRAAQNLRQTQSLLQP